MSKRPLWLIKIGTNVLSDSRGRLERRVLSGLVGQICRHGLPKYDIALVSSGAIGAGIGQLGLEARPDDIVMRQVCASVGQGVLMKHYHDLFARYGRHVAQILVTHDTLHEPVSIRNMKNMMRRLPQLGVVPVINENDAIATTEIGPLHQPGPTPTLTSPRCTRPLATSRPPPPPATRRTTRCCGSITPGRRLRARASGI